MQVLFHTKKDMFLKMPKKAYAYKCDFKKTWVCESGPHVIKLYSCSTQLKMKFQLLIKTKMLKNKDISCF